jgi:predicted SnoaL-like aldol condensation-catalyzing enzyme
MMCRRQARLWLALTAATLLASCGRAGSPVAATAHPDPLAALASSDPALAANKRLVFDLWRTVVNAGQIEAADHMLAEGYIQHSPVLPTGRNAFKQIFSAVPRREIPALVEPPLVASIAEGDLVVMSLLERVAATPASSAFITTHFNLFRVADGRLAEHWHSVRSPPGATVPLPENGGPRPVTGASGAAQEALLAAAEPQLARNKRLVFDMWRTVIEAGAQEKVGSFFAADFADHSPTGASGLRGVKSRIAARADAPLQPWIGAPLVALVAEGDLVALVTMQELPHPVHTGRTYTITWFNQFRIADGRIVEHWDAATPTDAGNRRGW